MKWRKGWVTFGQLRRVMPEVSPSYFLGGLTLGKSLSTTSVEWGGGETFLPSCAIRPSLTSRAWSIASWAFLCASANRVEGLIAVHVGNLDPGR